MLSLGRLFTHFLSQQMNITLNIATDADKVIVQNLGRFYVYDMSRYCGFSPGWETPPNGLFEDRDRSSYWEESNHAFLIRVDNELAGFVLVNKIGSTPDVDWHMGEFFVVSKFQGKGVGRYAARQIFDQFPGIWEVDQMPENTAAIAFWEKVVDEYTDGKFQKEQKLILVPRPKTMNVLKFLASSRKESK